MLKDGEPIRDTYTHHSHLISKAINARDRGAKALLIVNGALEGEEKDLLVKFGSIAGPEDAGILVCHAKNGAVDEWLSREGKSLAQLQAEIDEGYRPKSFSLSSDLTISLEVDIERKQAKVHNVAGYLSWGLRRNTSSWGRTMIIWVSAIRVLSLRPELAKCIRARTTMRRVQRV